MKWTIQKKAAVSGMVTALGGAAGGYFACFYRQGHYHLYQGFGRNEYFEPESGMRFYAASVWPWVASGVAFLLFAWVIVAWRERRRLAANWNEALGGHTWLGVPLLSLMAHPLLGVAGVPVTLVPLFHAVVAVGLTVALAWGRATGPCSLSPRGERACYAILALIILISFGLLAWFNIRQLHALNLGFSDSGSIAESLHQTLRGRFMLTNNQGYKEPGHATSMDHLFGSRLAMVPVFWLFPYHETLLVAQALALALGALPVFLLARHVLGHPFYGLAFAASYLLGPPLLYLNFRSSYGPEEEGHAVPFLLFACYFLVRERPWKCIIASALAVAVKENFAAVTAMIGLWMALQTPHRRHGLGLFVGSIAYFAFVAKLILPLFDPQAYGYVLQYYRDFGGSVSEMAWTCLTKPSLVWEKLAEYRNLSFVLHLLVPAAMFSVFCPSALAILAPALFMLLLSANPMHHSILFWNHSSCIPVIFFSAVLGLERLGNLLGKNRPGGERRNGLVAAVLVCSALSSYLFFFRMMTPATFEVTPRARRVHELRSLVPEESSVLVTYRLASHFVDCRDLYLATRYLPSDQDFIILDPLDRFQNYEQTLRGRDAVLNDAHYGLVYREDQFLVFQKGSPRDKLWDGILLPERPAMEVKVNQPQRGFGTLLGWNHLRPAGPDSLVLETFWECRNSTDREYEVSVRFKLPGGEVIKVRHPMAHWLYPTTLWKPGDIVRDVTRIVFDKEAPIRFKMAISLVDWREP